MEENLKALLLKDLCARFPYGVRLHIPSFSDTPQLLQQISDYETITINDYEISIDEVKPYLRSMSSMTEEEFEDFYDSSSEENDPYDVNISQVDWLISHHFDYRDLIPKGLALEALPGMYSK